MKIEQQFSEPEHITGRQPYRIRIEGRDGQAFEVVEQMGGGFSLTGVSSLNARLVISPIGANTVVLKIQ